MTLREGFNRVLMFAHFSPGEAMLTGLLFGFQVGVLVGFLGLGIVVAVAAAVKA